MSGAVGASDPLPTPTLAADDSFEVRYKIPSTMHSYQGMGGGMVTAGSYSFWSQPPMCMVAFVVLAA